MMVLSLAEEPAAIVAPPSADAEIAPVEAGTPIEAASSLSRQASVLSQVETLHPIEKGRQLPMPKFASPALTLGDEQGQRRDGQMASFDALATGSPAISWGGDSGQVLATRFENGSIHGERLADPDLRERAHLFTLDALDEGRDDLLIDLLALPSSEAQS
jgi:hypothetical protein